jgi:hypothetical protein
MSVRFVDSAVDPSDLLYPLSALAVFQPQDLVTGPVKVIGDVGYLSG